MELRVNRPSGEERSVWLRVKFARGADGNVLRAVGTLYDGTERKQIEERLERSGRLVSDRSSCSGCRRIRSQRCASVSRPTGR